MLFHGYTLNNLLFKIGYYIISKRLFCNHYLPYDCFKVYIFILFNLQTVIIFLARTYGVRVTNTQFIIITNMLFSCDPYFSLYYYIYPNVLVGTVISGHYM